MEHDRRELWETLVDLLEVVDVQQTLQSGIHVRSIEVDLPVEIVARFTEVGFQLLIDPPHWRWESGFPVRSGRLKVTLQESEND